MNSSFKILNDLDLIKVNGGSRESKKLGYIIGEFLGKIFK